MEFKGFPRRLALRVISGLLAVGICLSLTGCKGEEVYDGVYKTVENGEDVFTSDLWGPMHEISFWGMNMLVPDDFETYEPSAEEKESNSYWQYDRTYYKGNTTISAYVIGAGSLINYTDAVLEQKSAIKEYNDPPTRIVVEEPNFFYYQFEDYDQFGMFKQAGDYIIFVWIISDTKDKDNLTVDSSSSSETAETRVADARSEVTLEMARQIEASMYVPGLQDAQGSSGEASSKTASDALSGTSSEISGEASGEVSDTPDETQDKALTSSNEVSNDSIVIGES